MMLTLCILYIQQPAEQCRRVSVAVLRVDDTRVLENVQPPVDGPEFRALRRHAQRPADHGQRRPIYGLAARASMRFSTKALLASFFPAGYPSMYALYAANASVRLLRISKYRARR